MPAPEPWIYLDHNATTPMLPVVVEAMAPFHTERFANPSSAHRFGQQARQALEAARDTVAERLDCEPTEVLFTSGATESNNTALFGLLPRPERVLTSPLEHPSVRGPLEHLARLGTELLNLPLTPAGQLDELALAEASRRKPSLVTLQLANHEMGAVQPVARLATLLGNTPIHCDATQAAGKLPVSFRELGVTTLAASAHKFHGPKGIGLLLVRQGTTLAPRFVGGTQQQGLRPGTVPVALAVGLATALKLACEEMATRTAHLQLLRDLFHHRLRAAVPDLELNGPTAGGLVHTLNLSFPGIDAATLFMKLDLAGVACSTGSACASGSLLPSPVLRAMGLPEARVRSALRFSLGCQQTTAEIEAAANRIAQAVRELRADTA